MDTQTILNFLFSAVAVYFAIGALISIAGLIAFIVVFKKIFKATFDILDDVEKDFNKEDLSPTTLETLRKRTRIDRFS